VYELRNASALGRLLEEISWEGRRVELVGFFPDGYDGLGFDVTPGEQAGGAAAAWFAVRVRTLRLRVGETSTKMIEVNCDAR